MQVQFHIREFDYTIQKFSSQSRFVTEQNTEISQAITMQLITGVIEQFQSQLKSPLRMQAWCGIELKALSRSLSMRL